MSAVLAGVLRGGREYLIGARSGMCSVRLYTVACGLPFFSFRFGLFLTEHRQWRGEEALSGLSVLADAPWERTKRLEKAGCLGRTSACLGTMQNGKLSCQLLIVALLVSGY